MPLRPMGGTPMPQKAENAIALQPMPGKNWLTMRFGYNAPMDPLTHGLLGAVTAQLGFRQRLGGGATWAAVAAAMLPDVDVFIPRVTAWLGHAANDLPLLLEHRGVTHSLAAAPVIGLAVAVIWRLATRSKRGQEPFPQQRCLTPSSSAHPEVLAQRQEAQRRQSAAAAKSRRFLPALLCMTLAALTHPMIDLLTSYGTMIFAPWDTARYAMDVIAIVDIPFTLTLLLTLMFCFVTREDLWRRRARIALGGFILAGAYLGAGLAAHAHVVAMARQEAGDSFVQADAYPAPGSILLWRSLLQTRDAWQVKRVHLLSGWVDPPAAAPAQSGAPAGRIAATRPAAQRATILKYNRWVDLALEQPDVKRFYARASGHVLATYEKTGGKDVVRLHDLRYGREVGSLETLWCYEVAFGPGGKIVSQGTNRHERRQLWDMVAAYWKDMITP